MYDIAHHSNGGQVILATSSDPKHPSQYIIDGDKSTFWTSTGLFPQEFIISFQSLMTISTVQVWCSNVRCLVVERSVKADPVDFEAIFDKELESTDGRLQMEQFQADGTSACHLKFVITSGYAHFTSVHSVVVEGEPVR
ncbi:intraflagellar transport protein 25 homolog [Oscarella lobularis]|uniref:intraflagellar transport protein 25 homolog n=1 Tax=Oscarella lobularis TaxID=121494 RepID=UPI003313EE07